MKWFFNFRRKDTSKAIPGRSLDPSDPNFQIDLWSSICEYLEQFPDRISLLNELERLPLGPKMLYTTIWLESEVQNGGFNQFFWNHGGGKAQMAIKGYDAIGANKLKILASKAYAIYDKEFDQMEKFYNKHTLVAFSESYKETQLTKLDDQFYEMFDISKMEALRDKYIKDHLSEFEQFINR